MQRSSTPSWLLAAALLLVALLLVGLPAASAKPYQARTLMRFDEDKRGDNPYEGQPTQNAEYYADVGAHPFNASDLVRADRLGDGVVAPDGSAVVFSRRVWNYERNVSSTTLWMRALSSGSSSAAVPLTPFAWGASDNSPCWSKDSGVVFYLGGDDQQLYQVNVGSLAVNKITSFPLAIDTMLCSPHTTTIAFSMKIYPGLSIDETNERNEAWQAQSTRAYTFDKLYVRHWDTWFEGRRNHPFLASLSKSNGVYSLSTPVDLIKDVDADAPTLPYGGSEEWSFSSNDDEFSFTRRYDESPAVAWQTNLDIFTVQITNGQYSDPSPITAANRATDTQPQYQPDGLLIAYLTTKIPGYEADKYRVALYNRGDGSRVILTEEWDRSVGSVDWSPDGSRLIVTALESARNKIFSLDLKGVVTPLVVEHGNAAPSMLPDGSFTYSQSSMNYPSTIFLYNPKSNTSTQLTHFNADLLATSKMSQPQEFWFSGAKGDRIHGWFLYPVDYQQGDTNLPVAYLIHGGPQGSWSDDWSYRWNPQIYAANGMAVAMIDFHGSEGYGQEFTDSIRQDYGGKPFTDVLDSLDFLIANYPMINEQRIIGLGASYGGWMVNWINGHTTRFRALVCHDGIYDQRILWAETEELFFPEHDMGGTPFNKTALRYYEQWNPSLSAGLWQTPELVIHGGKDFRIPITHGLATFTSLQRRYALSHYVSLARVRAGF
eukprot:TRINITY_DN1258_c0_g1_i3.p1 TRINITY_DN1258_c0_g1~~TRINITY_DN1258_c0_g1_i3.p1  ORF type:complete len:715 (+),score=175.49 TRINITY_DN1258_c0_g1_i3:76-2220(+)